MRNSKQVEGKVRTRFFGENDSHAGAAEMDRNCFDQAQDPLGRRRHRKEEKNDRLPSA